VLNLAWIFYIIQISAAHVWKCSKMSELWNKLVDRPVCPRQLWWS